MPSARIITPKELADRLGEPNLVIFDCRFSLEDAEYGLKAYEQGHIAGAWYLDLNKDLSSEPVDGITGRHPLPRPETLAAKLRESGLNQDSVVVLYDDGLGAFAARGWWLLHWLGKRNDVYLLEDGIAAWEDEELPLVTQEPDTQPGQFEANPDDSLLISAEELLRKLKDPELTLIDARSPARYRGEMDTTDPVNGHIPGAQCAPFTENVDGNGQFLSKERLRERFDGFLNGRPAEKLVAYCGSGVTACHNLFAMSLAGYPMPRLYAGSWSEWITDPSNPVKSGRNN